jgi:hypothetical protein
MKNMVASETVVRSHLRVIQVPVVTTGGLADMAIFDKDICCYILRLSHKNATSF